MNEGLPDFSGKLVFVNLAGGGECHQLLADPRFEDQGGQLFLVGTVPATRWRAKWISRINWLSGRR